MSWAELIRGHLSAKLLRMDEFLKNQIFATHAVAAVGSVTLSTVLTYPLDTIKTIIQVQFLANVNIFCHVTVSVWVDLILLSSTIGWF